MTTEIDKDFYIDLSKVCAIGKRERNKMGTPKGINYDIVIQFSGDHTIRRYNTAKERDYVFRKLIQQWTSKFKQYLSNEEKDIK